MWQDRLGEGERGSALQERGGPAGGEEETVAGHRCQWQWTSLSGEGHILRGVGILTPFDPGAGGADLAPPPRANAYSRKKSMGGNSDNFCIFLNVCWVC